MARSVYATIEDLRKAGLSDDALYDDLALRALLELASVLVESLTQQVFGPVYKTFKADGLGRRLFEDPDRNKIIEIFKVEVLRFGLVRRLGFLSDAPQLLVEFDDYTKHERFVRLLNSDTSSSPFNRAFRDLRQFRYPNDAQNIEITGVFGWMDLETKHETVLSADLTANATSIQVDDTGEVEPNDLLLIDQRFWVIVKDIVTPSTPEDPGPPVVPLVPGSINIDPAPKKAASGTPVIRYGKVPLLLRNAVIRTAIASRFPVGSDSEQGRLDQQRIRREETDNYEIEFFQSPNSTQVNTGTGDPIADVLLSNFRAPTISLRHV